jgi:tetraacyldisaccharide 4'-kinase
MQRISPALAPILFVPGLLYEALVHVRNGLYTSGVLPRRRLPGPVISVGNITLGGTGKTPLVLHIAKAFASQGYQPVILTRGYKRSRPNETLILSPSEIVSSAAGILGDEPAVMRRHMPWAWMGVSRNRFLAGSRISRQLQKAVFILDDGFQHRKLNRDLDIVVLDCTQSLQSNRVFPRGTLREPLSGLRRGDVVVLNGAQGGNPGGPIVETVTRLVPKAAIFRCNQSIETMVPFRAWSEMTLVGPSQQPRSAYLVAALGNPERFEQDVRRLGIDVVGKKLFPDHYWPSLRDWQTCAADARSRHAEAIVTTEKDAVKIASPPDFPLVVTIQSTAISDATAFEMILRECVEKRLRDREYGTR